jgi:hypothetical protein
MGCSSFGLSLAFPFCLPCDSSGHRSFIGFLCFVFHELNLSPMHNAQSCEKRGKKERGITHALFQHCEKEKEYKQGGWHCRAHFLLRLEAKRNMRWQKETTKQKKLKGKDAPHPKP